MGANFNTQNLPRHDDMLGILGTGLTGANQWNVKNINDTLFPLGWLRNNSSDFATVRIQSPHWRKQNELLDSIHIHYVLDSVPTVGQTALYDVYYTWLIPGQVVPSLSNWSLVSNITQTFTGAELAYQYNVFSFVTNIPAPLTESYGVYLLFKVIRGNGTYTGEIGVLDIDAHAIKDRMGSLNEFTD